MSAHHAVVDFFSNWSIYRAVIEHNCMEHREISAALHRLLSRRAGPYRLLDLGCGDAAAIGPAMRGTPVSQYVGVDCAAPALDFARATLTDSGAQLDLRVGQLMDAIETPDTGYDVIHAAFVLHHLDSASKRRFLAAAKSKLAPHGELLLIDVVRHDAETREQYLDRYEEFVSRWPIGADKQAALMTHVRGFDHPEALSTLPVWAAELGFTTIETFYSGGSDTQHGWRLMA